MNHSNYFIVLLALSLALAACGTGPASEKPASTTNDARSEEQTSSGDPTGAERTTTPDERAVVTGIVTAAGSSTWEGKPVRLITVEEDPDAECPKGPTTPGCEKMTFTVNDETRLLWDEGCDHRAMEEASVADLKVGQRVRADHTGYGVAESYPGQTIARSIAICAEAPENATAASHRDGPQGKVFFPKQPSKPNAYMMAEISGKLVLDDEGCLRIEEPPNHTETVPIWPVDFELDTSGGEVRVLDKEGRVVGQVGKPIEMGGGELPSRDTSATAQSMLENEAMVRELFERCPGYYWIVGTGVRIPPQQ